MTHDEAIESLIGSCTELKKAVLQLQEENAFLADTIEKNNLGQIKTERRSLLSEIEHCKEKAKEAIKEASRIKSEYESKMSEADSRFFDAKRKQENIDLYIEKQAENKVKDIKVEYETYKRANDEALDEYVAKINKLMQEKELSLKKKNKKYLVIAIISVIFCVLGIIIGIISIIQR